MIPVSLINKLKKVDWPLVIGISGLFLVVALLWAPFGLKTTGSVEAWAMLYKAENQPLLAKFGFSRILVYLPWELAYLISGNSFVGAQLVLAFLLFAKGLLLFLILRGLRIADQATAFLVGVLFIIYPADEGTFLLRALGRHTGVFFYMLAVFFLVLSLNKKNWLYYFMMTVFEGTSLLIAEAGIPLMFFTPLIFLFWRDKFSNEKRKQITIIWYIVPLLYTVWILYGLFFVQNSLVYQKRRFADGFNDFSFFIVNVFHSNLLAYYRGFWTGWLASFRLLSMQREFIYISVAVMLVVCSMAWIVNYLTGINVLNNNDNKPVRFFFPLLFGLIIFGLGFFPYSVTDLRYDKWRVFYYSIIGSALIFGVVYFHLSRLSLRWGKVIFMVLWAPTLFFATLSSLNQKNSFVDESYVEQKVLSTLIEQAPYIKPETEIVMIVDSAQDKPFPNNNVFSYAIHWLYQRGNLNGIICYVNSPNCVFTDKALAVEGTPKKSSTGNEYLYKNILFFSYKPNRGLILLQKIPGEFLNDNSDSGYNPYNLISGYIPFPKRPQEAFEKEYSPHPVHVSPIGWNGEGLTMNDRKVCNEAYSGRCSLLISGDDGTTTTFSQELDVEGNSGDTLTLKLCSKAIGFQKHVGNQKAPFALLTTSNTNGDSVDYKMPISWKLESWDCMEQVITSKQPYTHITITLENDSPTGRIWVDDVQLLKNLTEIKILNAFFEK